MIILVVLTHSGISFINNIGYILMAYFFMVSGYCYKKGKRSVKDSIWFVILMVLLASTETLPFMIQLPYGLGRGFFACACTVIIALLRILDRFTLPLVTYIGQNTMVIYSWHMIFLTPFSLLLLKIFNVEMARDEFFMSIIPENYTLLIILAAALAIACCMLLTKITRKKTK